MPAHKPTVSPCAPAAPSGAPSDRGQLLVFDDITYDRLASLPLAAQELPCSLCSVAFAGDDTPYYALGTAIVKPEEYEPSKGRLLLLAYRCGAVFCVCVCGGGRGGRDLVLLRRLRQLGCRIGPGAAPPSLAPPTPAPPRTSNTRPLLLPPKGQRQAGGC